MKNSLTIYTILGAGGLICTTAFGGTIGAYVNETDLPQEADFVNLQFPYSLSISAGTSTGNIYGRIYEASMTPAAGANASILAQLGIGPAGSDPRISPSWVWSSSTFNVQVGNDDEYQASTIVNTPGSYNYTFRFSLDNGATFTLGDIDGAGSNPGLTFSPAQLGALQVTPEPTSVLLLGVGGLLLGSCRRRTTGSAL
jgi:hypothetical protein